MTQQEIKSAIERGMLGSISAHNTQPFSLKQTDETTFEVWAEQARLLSVGDPHNKDFLMGLGAFVEALDLAVSPLLLNMSLVKTEVPGNTHPKCRIAELRLQKATHSPDALEKQLERRFSYRGSFQKDLQATWAEKKITTLEAGRGTRIYFINDSEQQKKIARLYDQVNLKFLRIPGYEAELFHWMRLTPRHPRYYFDGMNDQSMALNKIEALGAGLVMQPSVFSVLDQTGLAKIFVSELPKITSAATLAVVTSPLSDRVQSGRSFLRGWLKMTEQNLFGAPLSLLTDDEQALHLISSLIDLPPNRQVDNIFRVGYLPDSFNQPPRARRPVSELWEPA